MKNVLKSFTITIVILLFFGKALSQKIPKSVSLPGKKPVVLKPYGRLGGLACIEPSGLVKSRVWENIYWSHNDSEDEPRIFPVRREGSVVESRRYNLLEGIVIPDAVNVDWEDIATDNAGNLIIGDFGNQGGNDRRDLVLYIINEPSPTQRKTCVKSRIFFSYPDQKKIPDDILNFDAEALFWTNERLYILTKHRSNTYTKLYRLDSIVPDKVNPLTLLDTFDIRGQVTGADVTPDGKKLAVLTYTAIWLFEVYIESDAYFDGRISWLPIDIGQCEAICFDGDNLIISSNEQGGDFYEIPLENLILVKE